MELDCHNHLARKGKHAGAATFVAVITLNTGCEAVVTRNEKLFRGIKGNSFANHKIPPIPTQPFFPQESLIKETYIF